MEELLLEKNLLVLNCGSEPTFQTVRAQSIIDVTVVNSHAMRTLNVNGWEVLSEESFSDHRYIYFSIGKYAPKEEMYRNLKKANWEKFRAALESDALPVVASDGENLDECGQVLQAHISRALDAAAPLRPALNRSPSPWWNETLDKLRNELRLLAQKRKRSLEDENAYKSLRKLYTKHIRRAKKESWRNFCSSAENAKEISKIMKILKPTTQKRVSLFNDQGEVLSPALTLKKLMDTHFIDSLAASDEVEAVSVGSTEDRGNRTLSIDVMNYIDEQKVCASLASFGPLKAPGPDGFKPLVLQMLSVEYTNYITKLYKIAVRCERVPAEWLQMRVVFIPKEGKKDYGTAKAYRPITLSNFLLKGLERVLQWYITDMVITKPLYSQHAYTVGRSCDTAVSEAVDFIERNILRKQHVLAVSLDCSGAFDRIQFSSASMAMEKKEIPPVVNKLYDHILRNRRVSATLQGEECVRIPTRGSPQGGVLSPMIWNIIMDTLLSTFKNTAIKIVGYADDILLLVAGVDPPTLIQEMNGALKKVVTWGDKNGLVFNPEKTQVVRFSQCKRFSSWKRLRMKHTEMEYGTEMKYLGVTLNRYLTWRPHCHERVRKGITTINLANAAIGQKWGLSPERTFWVYTAMARCVSTYGSLVWANNVTETIKNDLQRLQRKAMKSMSACMRSTPTTGLEVTMGLIPLDLHASEQAVRSRLRTRELLTDVWDGVGTTKKGHRLLADKILNKIETTKLPCDKTKTHRMWSEFDEVKDPNIMVYTDGSKMNDTAGAGWAAVHGDHIIAEESIHLGPYATVFQSEIVAIERSLLWCTENLDDDTEVLIYSDSQSGIQALLSSTTNSRTVLSCKSVLRTARENLRIGIKWIKGHADHTGNELADSLAKSGSQTQISSVEPQIPIPSSTVNCAIKQYFETEWQRRWDKEKACRQTKILLPHVDGRRLKKIIKKPKTDINLIIQVCTGHAVVAHHLAQWVRTLKDECGLCEESYETTSHILDECPVLEVDRREIFKGTNDLFNRILRLFSLRRVETLIEDRSLAVGDRLTDQF